jgi:hypothetical protein
VLEHPYGVGGHLQPGTDLTEPRGLLIELDVDTFMPQGKSGDGATDAAADDDRFHALPTTASNQA